MFIMDKFKEWGENQVSTPEKQVIGDYMPNPNNIFKNIVSNNQNEILHLDEKFVIYKKGGEKTPYFDVEMPELSFKEKVILRNLQDKAISGINIDPLNRLNEEDREKAFLSEVRKMVQIDYPSMSGNKKDWIAKLIVQNMVGFGLLEPLLKNDSLEEIMVVGIGKNVNVYHAKFGMCRTNIIFDTDNEIKNIISRIASSVGRQFNISNPLLDARLPDGSRVNATISPVSLDGPSLTIRKYKKDPFTITDLISSGTVNYTAAAFLWMISEGYGAKPANILISGGTSSGKTTTLNCMGSFINSRDRVVSIEDTAELQLPLEHWIRLETRNKNTEGRGEVNMENLLKNCLRMTPDRIIVGEVRGAEAITLIGAMNLGHDGCQGTLHSNSSKETITRLTNPPMSVPKVMIPSLDFIIMQNRFSIRGKSVRRISEIAEVLRDEEGYPVVKLVYKWDPRDDQTKATGTHCQYLDELSRLKGVDKKNISQELERRAKLLRFLVENKIRKLDDISKIMNRYYIEKHPDEFIASLIEKEKEISWPENENVQKYSGSIPTLNKNEKEILDEIEREAIKQIAIDPTSIKNKKDSLWVFIEKVREIIERMNFKISHEKITDLANIVSYNMIGYGLIEFLLYDDDLEEIFVVGTGRPVYVNHRINGISTTNIVFENDGEILRIIQKIASSVGRRIDRSSPLLDAHLSDGSRVNATIPPISLHGPTLTIRKKRDKSLSIKDFMENGSIDPALGSFLWMVVEGLGLKPGNIIAAGGTGSGKTTFLNVLASFIPSTERVITIEDTAELNLHRDHVIRLETRPPSVEGSGEITMDDLVKNTLRMRPDRIIVGEVRGSEAATLFTAMNTGHEGCMGTVHANSAKETLIRLQNPPMNVPRIMLPALDLILMQNKILHNNRVLRRVTEVVEVNTSNGGPVELNPIYLWNPTDDSFKRTENQSQLLTRLSELKGISMDELELKRKDMEKILSWMKNANIIDSNQISGLLDSYYYDEEEFLKMIDGNI